jgi:HD-like signal output (HDOD) protein
LNTTDNHPAGENTQLTPLVLAQRVSDLVSLPDVYLRVRTLLDDPDATLNDIAGAISLDSGLTTRLLRIANSAYFGFSAQIDSVTRAITLVGTQQVHDLVLATSVVNAFSGVAVEGMEMKRFWRTSLLCAAGSRVLAERCGILDSGRIFIAGLLAHVGRLVLWLQQPAAMRQAQLAVGQQGTTIHQALDEILGFDDAAIADELLNCWNLPDTLVEPVRRYPHPASDQGALLEASIVHIASAVADAAGQQSSRDELIRQLDGTAWSATGLTPDSLVTLMEEAETLTAELAEMFLPALPPVTA